MIKYADSSFYYNVYGGTVLECSTAEYYLKRSCRHIDSMTFNRIKFENLTEFQQEIIREAVCIQADFEYENRDILNMYLKSYSINGVSLSADTEKIIKVNGVCTSDEVYSLLMQTGLMCRRL